jgi:hypothetical protein
MAPFWKEIVWKLWVCWISTRTWFNKVWFRFSGCFRENNNTEGLARRWGDSAPNLNEAPRGPLARPLEKRIMRAYGLLKSGQGSQQEWMNLTSVVTEIIGNNKESNLAARPDIYISTIQGGFHPNLEKLFVTYKHGMREYHVCYKDTFVFPPATNLPVINVEDNDRGPKGEGAVSGDAFGSSLLLYGVAFSDISLLWREFSGPGRDFYSGSDYETTIRDIVQFFAMNRGNGVLKDPNTLDLCDEAEIHIVTLEKTIIISISDTPIHCLEMFQRSP